MTMQYNPMDRVAQIANHSCARFWFDSRYCNLDKESLGAQKADFNVPKTSRVNPGLKC